VDPGVVRAALILLLLIPPAYWDLRTREIEPKYWLVTGLIVLLACIISYREILSLERRVFLMYLVTSLLALLIVGISYFIGIMGGADLFALIVIALGVPESVSPSLFGVPFLTTLYASLTSMVLPISFCVTNIARHRKHLRGRPKMLCFLGLPFRASKLSSDPGFWFPLETYDEQGNRRVRFTFNIEEEPEDIRRLFKRLIERGVIKKEQVVYATPGIPFLIFILIGYIISILLGDAPITAFLGAMA